MNSIIKCTLSLLFLAVPLAASATAPLTPLSPLATPLALLDSVADPSSPIGVDEEDERIPNMIEDLDPFDPNVEDVLREYDRIYEEETGLSPFIGEDPGKAAKCRRDSCAVWVQIVRSTQRLHLYEKGQLIATWKVSTGKRGYTTPRFDRHPNGRIYDRYTSRKYPGGDYKGLGNMPYAVFIQGGFAVHGTPRGNWSKLGKPASHGCIRLHPDNAYRLNRMIRRYGITDSWFTVQ